MFRQEVVELTSNDLHLLVQQLKTRLGRFPTDQEIYDFVFSGPEVRNRILRDGKVMLEINKYLKKPFEVQAVQVTAENIYDVAKWCQGDMASSGNDKYIKVRVIHAVSERQTQAFVGDWVLYAGTSYRVYTDRAFQKSFEVVKASEAAAVS